MQAVESLLPGVAEIQIGEQPPDANRDSAQQGALYTAESSHPSRGRDTRYTVGQQEIQIFMRGDRAKHAKCFHHSVMEGLYNPT